MATATYTISVISTGHSSGSRSTEPAAKTIASAAGDCRKYSLSNGNNTITHPSGAVLGVIVPITATALSLRGAAGDTGLSLSITLPSAVSIDGVMGSWVINSTGTAVVEISFY